jgi:hypothetical protein
MINYRHLYYFWVVAVLMLRYRHRDSEARADRLIRRDEVRVLAGPLPLIKFI